MRHKRYPITTVPCSFEKFQNEAYSARIFTGTIFINLKNGRFAYKDNLQRQIPSYEVYEAARTVNSFSGKLIAKRQSRDQPLQLVKYKIK